MLFKVIYWISCVLSVRNFTSSNIGILVKSYINMPLVPMMYGLGDCICYQSKGLSKGMYAVLSKLGVEEPHIPVVVNHSFWSIKIVGKITQIWMMSRVHNKK